MFAAKFPKSWADTAAEEGEIGLLLKIMQGFEDFRPGGYTCQVREEKAPPALRNQPLPVALTSTARATSAPRPPPQLPAPPPLPREPLPQPNLWLYT